MPETPYPDIPWRVSGPRVCTRIQGHVFVETTSYADQAGGNRRAICKLCGAVDLLAAKEFDNRLELAGGAQKPTEEGKRRWDPDGYYEGIPCICNESCKPDCKGECGCHACGQAYQDQLSVDYD